MSLNDTPEGERIHIGFFGMRNAGKSSLVNCITGQETSLVSDIKGTTTDPVKKSMELLPLGPVTLIDTPGYDDDGKLGLLRIGRTKDVLKTCDIAVLVTESREPVPEEAELIALIKERDIPLITALNKSGSPGPASEDPDIIPVNASTGEGIESLKERLASVLKDREKKLRLVADFIAPGDRVVLVIPIDTSAPKGRLILPQQLAIRDILDAGAVSIVTGPDNLTETLNASNASPALVITDSQIFSDVMKLVPEHIPLTSFSILMARYKGFLEEAVKGARTVDSLEDGAKILISEGCTHHRQCEDIGTVKLPRWLRKYTGKDLDLSFSSGHGFTDDPGQYDLIIHCGACMLNDREMQSRMEEAVRAGVPFTNYGTVIAHMNGILERSIKPVIKA